MARRYIKRQEELQDIPHTEDELLGIELEKEIIEKIGPNKTKEYQLKNELDLVLSVFLMIKVWMLILVHMK